MSETSILLNAYYEALYERLEARKELLAARIDELLTEEIKKRGFEGFNQEKYTAYKEACLAFVDERIEAYNPIGIQYVYERRNAPEVIELELQLNWYDSRAEFAALVEAARNKARPEMTDDRLRPLTSELIKQVGAFPNKSIITAYEASPGLNKLPDYYGVEEISRMQQGAYPDHQRQPEVLKERLKDISYQAFSHKPD